MKEYKTPAIAFIGMNPRILYQSIDEIITSKGGNEVSNIANFHAYEIPEKGAILVSINNPPSISNFINCNGRIDKPISGFVQLLGFKKDEYFNGLYSTLLEIQE